MHELAGDESALSGNDSDSTHWRACAQEKPLIWRSWGESHFVYHPRSGQTHFLNELGAWILREIDETAQPVALLATRLTAAYGGDETADLIHALESSLQVLRALGLVEPSPEETS